MPRSQVRLLDTLSDTLKKRHMTIATAESCTGGLLAHLLTNVPGSSEYFDRGVIPYSNRSKIELLNVPEKILKKHGAVSEETARAMAEGIRTRADVDIGVSTTGIAGPTGGSKEKPVGLVYIGIATQDDVKVKRFMFSGDRVQNKTQACNAAMSFLLEVLMNG